MTKTNMQHHKSDKNSYNNIFLLSSLLIILIIFCGGLFIFFKYYSNKNNKKTPTTISATKIDTSILNKDEKTVYDTTNSFLSKLKEGNYQAAFALMGDELKNQYPGGLNDFTNTSKKANLQTIKDWTISKVETNGNKDRISVKGTALFDTPNPTGRIEFGYYKTPDGDYKMYLWQVYPEL